jgi:hypothetical protein
MRWARGVLVLSTIFFLACGSDDPADPDDGGNNDQVGTFSAMVSGAANSSFTGSAFFASTPQGFTLTLTAAPGTVAGIGVTRVSGGRPPTGTHQIGSPASSGQIWGSGYVGNTSNSYVSSSGSLVISGSTTGELAGTVQFQGNGTFNGAPGLVAVTATFRAVCAAVSLVCN